MKKFNNKSLDQIEIESYSILTLFMKFKEATRLEFLIIRGRNSSHLTDNEDNQLFSQLYYSLSFPITTLIIPTIIRRNYAHTVHMTNLLPLAMNQ